MSTKLHFEDYPQDAKYSSVSATLFAFKSERKSMKKKTHPCVEADIEEFTHFAPRGWSPSVIYLAVNGTVTSLTVFIQNILNLRTKLLRDSERHGGEMINDKIFLLVRSIPLSVYVHMYNIRTVMISYIKKRKLGWPKHTIWPLSYSAIFPISSFICSMFCLLLSSHS